MMKRVEEYLAMRRALGFELVTSAGVLRGFARFADRVAPGSHLTLELALRWAQVQARKRSTAASRLTTLRPFARYLQITEPRTVIPPKGILGPAQHRRVPHIYTEQQIRDLMDAALRLRPSGGLRPLAMRTYLGLLSCTGMRPQEPLHLTRQDVDLRTNTLAVRETKFAKSRIVVVHPTAGEVLRKYALFRDHHVRCPRSSGFFILDDGSQLTGQKARWAFQRLRRQLGWKSLPGRPAPRLYDLRHSFVCRRLLQWYRDAVDVHVAMPSLSTYIGHVKLTDTYWYVTGIPELMEVVSCRFERFVFCRQRGGI